MRHELNYPFINLRRGDFINTLFSTAQEVPEPKSRRSKGTLRNDAVLNAIEVVMKNGQWFTVAQLVPLVKKSRCTVRKALTEVLEPRGLVINRRTDKKVNVEFEWGWKK